VKIKSGRQGGESEGRGSEEGEGMERSGGSEESWS
jgi:hypothetical protein